jgi:hypothetical protein
MSAAKASAIYGSGMRSSAKFQHLVDPAHRHDLERDS